VYEETLTGRPHDTSVQKATSDNEMWMQFNVMPRTLAVEKELHRSIRQLRLTRQHQLEYQHHTPHTRNTLVAQPISSIGVEFAAKSFCDVG